MAKQTQLRRGTTAEHSTFTGAVGEVTVDTTKDTLVVHDGIVAGGVAMAKQTDVELKADLAGNNTQTFKVADGVADDDAVSKGQMEANSVTPSYGVTWDEVGDTYTRTGSSEYTSIQSKMKRCLLTPAGNVSYYLDANNSNYKEDGTASVLTGADGDVMVEIPRFYMKYSYVGTTHSWSISTSMQAGYVIHPAFIKAGIEVTHRYIGAYTASTNGTILKSVSGEYCDTSMTRGTMRTRAAAVGTGWSLQDWNTVSAIQLLMLVEFANSTSVIVAFT